MENYGSENNSGVKVDGDKNGENLNVNTTQIGEQDQAIMKSDEIVLSCDEEETNEDQGRCALIRDRERLRGVLHSHKFQVVIITLVVLDFLIVLVQLLMDIQVIKGVHHDHLAITILHYTSIVILGIFCVEILVKFYAFGVEFFHHKLEVFDAIVVVISFALDIAYSGNADAWDAVGLLVLLRLWRIVRIANGIVLSVKIEMDEKMKHLKDEISDLEKQLEQYKNKCKDQESQIAELHSKLNETIGNNGREVKNIRLPGNECDNDDIVCT